MPTPCLQCDVNQKMWDWQKTHRNSTYSSRLCADDSTQWSMTLFNSIIQYKLCDLKEIYITIKVISVWNILQPLKRNHIVHCIRTAPKHWPEMNMKQMSQNYTVQTWVVFPQPVSPLITNTCSELMSWSNSWRKKKCIFDYCKMT